MQFDAVTIAVIAGIVAVLLLATVAARRGGVDRDRGPFSSSTESQAQFAALGTTNPAARQDDDPQGNERHDHGGGHSHADGMGAGDQSHGGDAGGHGHGNGDAGGGEDAGGARNGGGNGRD